MFTSNLAELKQALELYNNGQFLAAQSLPTSKSGYSGSNERLLRCLSERMELAEVKNRF